MYWNVLDERRRQVADRLGFMSVHGCYLAGGTALALELGHRESIDFDFFSTDTIDTHALLHAAESEFGRGAIRVQLQDDTALIFVVDDVNVSVYLYKYVLLYPTTTVGVLNLASIRDIGCMKLSAMLNRHVLKDFVDMSFILDMVPLPELMTDVSRAMPSYDRLVFLKALVDFEPVEQEEIVFLTKPRSWEVIQEHITKSVRAYSGV